ncbi:YeiH family protein [Rhodoferax koreense]|uniref:YeiH family protein n=1 Tax=Rhodoferax koreensis TaxID=1842727 RepID=UPI00373FE19C
MLPGLALTAAIASVSIGLGRSGWLQAHGISALTLSIVLGMLIGNTWYGRVGAAAGAGVAFSKANLLRLGIVLYGLRLTFQDIAHVGWAGVAIDASMLCSTFGLACLLGSRVFGLDRKTAMLIGAGSSICGAAAVMAADPVVRGRPEQVMVAVATVVVFGTVGIFLYPALYHLNAQYGWIAMSPTDYGVFAGSTIHEVAQVVAAGRAVSLEAANTAVIAKMVRVMMLAPFLVMLSAWLSRPDAASHPGDAHHAETGAPVRGGIAIPWFALGFVAVAGLNSLAVLPQAMVLHLTDVDTVLLAMAMAGLGLTTHVSAIRKAGVKPLALAAVLFAWLVGGGLAVNAGLGALFGLGA